MKTKIKLKIFLTLTLSGWTWNQMPYADVAANAFHDLSKDLLLQHVQTTWQLPGIKTQAAEVKASSSCSVPKPEKTLVQRLEHIIIPQVSICRIPFSQALRLLTEITRVHDLEGGGINFILVDPEHKDPEVNLTAQSISCKKILGYLAEMTRFEMAMDDNVIVFRDPLCRAAQIETKIFNVSHGSLSQLLKRMGSTARKQPVEKNESKAVHKEDDAKFFRKTQNLKSFFEHMGISFEDKGTGIVYDGIHIIASHRPVCLQKIESILSLYQDNKQVSIETKFLEIQQGVLEELGVRYNVNRKDRPVSGTQNSLRELSSLLNTSTVAKDFAIPNGLNLGTSTGNFLDATAFLNKYQMNFLLKSIEQRTDADLMSAPKVTVLSGHKAEIVVAQEFRYPQKYRDPQCKEGGKHGNQGSVLLAGVPEDFTTRNVGVELTVLPLVEQMDKIHLTLEPCVTEFDGFVQYGGKNQIAAGNNCTESDSGYLQPVFSTRKIKTEVLLQNGSTLVMGGLTREEIKETRDKIPVLSGIPLLGKLFSAKGTTTHKKNLLIFVTANLVDEKGRQTIETEFPL